MKKLFLSFLILAGLSLSFVSCDATDDDNQKSANSDEAVMFTKLAASFPVYSDPDISFTDVEVGVTTKSDVDRVYTVEVDLDNTTATTDMYSIATNSVTIPAGSLYGYLRIFGDYNEVGLNEYDLVLKLSETNAGVIVNRASTTLVMKQGCAENPVTLSIIFDDYASETTWYLEEDSTGDIYGAGAGYADGLATLTEEFCLPAGSYTLYVEDVYGDGLSYPANGSITLRNSVTNAVIGSPIIGDFGYGASISFTLP